MLQNKIIPYFTVMKNILQILLVISVVITIGCNNKLTPTLIPTTLIVDELETQELPSSVRALKVYNDQEIWFAGSKGIFGFTKDAGTTWTIDSMTYENKPIHFRAITLTSKAVFLMTIESPALIFKSDHYGSKWELVYKEENEKAFYDAIAFWDDQNGIAMGDPTEDCLSILITKNGGADWQKVACEKLPKTVEGEAAFAASNSNIALNGENVWIVSGGVKSRVFHSNNKGNTWQVYDTPIIQGAQMTGIFSIDFWDDKNGIIIGGDWNEKEKKTQNKAITNDGGKTWHLIADGQHPDYRSCIKYAPNSNGKFILTTGIPGTSYSVDSGKSWQKIHEEDFYTLDFGSDYKNIWLAGNKKIAKIIFKN